MIRGEKITGGMELIEDILAEFFGEAVTCMDRVNGSGVSEGEESAAAQDLAGEFEKIVKKYSKRIRKIKGNETV